MKKPIAVTLDSCMAISGVPEITDVSYDLWQLRMTLRFADCGHPVYCIFEAPRGFRVLDEGDLCEFWEPKARPAGWLWRIESGGWLDLERTRPTFVSGLTEEWTEFLVCGENDCVSVLADSEPHLELPKL